MEETFRSILLFGPPGVGKGTQGKILGTVPGFFHQLTVRIWKKALHAYVALSRFKPREDLLVLDGIPRNVEQTELVKDHLDILKVVHMKCSDEEDMIHRMRRRAIRENRADDGNEDVVRRRFEVYRERSAPLLACFPSEMIAEVDANGSPAEVLQAILKCLIPTQNEHFQEQGVS